MKVSVANERLVERPLSEIGRYAGACYGRGDESCARAMRCWRDGHMSVFEHVSVTWHVEGISRACSHQLVRHRLASYTQRSQRYAKQPVDPTGDDWYVRPPALERDRMFGTVMTEAAQSYLDALDRDVRPEDARYMLPEATKTSLYATMNLRELRHFHALRADQRAQWEIRELAEAMVDALPRIGEWLDVRALLKEDLR